MSRLAKSLVLFVIAFHLFAFVLEVFLWMSPAVHEPMLGRLVGRSPVPTYDQALILRPLFVNQGFYNLILAIAGIAGLVFLRRGDGTVGRTLVAYLCVAAVGAGIVLAFSTGAYVGAFLQAAPAALALVVIFGARRPAGPAGA